MPSSTNRVPLNWLDLEVRSETGRDKREEVQVVSWGVNDAQSRIRATKQQIDIAHLNLKLSLTACRERGLLQPQMTLYAKLIGVHCLFSTHIDTWFFFWTGTFWVYPVCCIKCNKNVNVIWLTFGCWRYSSVFLQRSGFQPQDLTTERIANFLFQFHTQSLKSVCVVCHEWVSLVGVKCSENAFLYRYQG